MKRILLGVLLGAMYIVGCGAAAGGPMVGMWELQMDEKLLKQMPAGMEKPTVTVDFKADGTFEGKMKMTGKESSASGTYKLDGKKLSMTTTKEDGKDKAGKTEEVTLADDMKSFDLPGAAGMGKMVKK